MKKIYYIIIAIIALSACGNVCAEYSVTRDESTLLAKCAYDIKDKSGRAHKIIIDITKDYNVELAYMDAYEPSNSGYHVVELSFREFTYENFIDQDGKLKCLDNVYYYTITGTTNSRQGKTIHYVQPNTELVSGAPSYVEPTPYGLNESESKIYVSDNYDEEVIEEEGWLKICHYGSMYLKFNKEKYETNIRPLVNHFGIDPGSLDIMSYLAKNNYSCPTSLCSKTDGARGYYYTNYMFKMEYDKNCITSQDFVSEYRCGSLEFHMKDYEELKTNGATILLNEKIEKIKQFCDSVYQNQNYNDPTYCVKECMDIDKIFTRDMVGTSGECGFSKRLLVWASNILRWIKYILPVAVIIFGILDFIKAIGADKDDEMKKAQKRFIIRLIAAALVFIIPLILEFVLDKMGFGYNDCGLF